VAISDPGRWWRYDAPLDPALVVITPAMEGESGLEEAGPLPLAEDGRFPEANLQFLAHLKAQALGLAQAAMATAMAAGRSMGEGPGDDANETEGSATAGAAGPKGQARVGVKAQPARR
jgi:hypothetical protein